MVLGQVPVQPGVIIRSRPIGVLMMEDEGGLDEKILCVPVDELHPYYGNVGSYRDLRPVMLDQIAHFFEHYKDLERGKWAKIKGWGEAEQAMDLIREAMDRVKAKA
ncbi:MAG: inorganic diphosphatase, partial [Rhodospirillales bacterium]